MKWNKPLLRLANKARNNGIIHQRDINEEYIDRKSGIRAIQRLVEFGFLKPTETGNSFVYCKEQDQTLLAYLQKKD